MDALCPEFRTDENALQAAAERRAQYERDYKRTEAEFNALDTDVFYRQWMGATA